MSKFRIGIFTSGGGPTSRRLVQIVSDKVADDTIPDSKIEYVVAAKKNETKNEEAMVVLVRKLGIPVVSFPSFDFERKLRLSGVKAAKKEDYSILSQWRELHDREIYRNICFLPVDIIILLGYMWIISDFLCQMPTPIINLHPALPDGPKGTYQEVIWQLIAENAKKSGVMMHLVTPELDRGPVVAMCSYPLIGNGFNEEWERMNIRLGKEKLEHIAQKEGMENPLWKAIRAEGVKREFPLVIWTIKSFAEGKIKVSDGKVYIPSDSGFDLTKEIDESLKTEVV